MKDLKTFMVTVEQRKVSIKTTQITVSAVDESDARVLARYREIPSWDWNRAKEEEHPQYVLEISEDLDVVDAYIAPPNPPHVLDDESPI